MDVYIVLYIVYKTPIDHVPVSISQKMLYSGDLTFLLFQDTCWIQVISFLMFLDMEKVGRFYGLTFEGLKFVRFEHWKIRLLEG